MSDEKLFGAATREFSSGVVDENLLAKARVLAAGDGKSAEIEYIKLRVEQLKSDRRNHLLRTASGSASTKLSSVNNVLRSYFSRNHLIGVLTLCTVGTLAALFVTNEVNGTCDRFRLANESYQNWINWIDDQGIDVRDMQLLPIRALEQRYGQEAVDKSQEYINIMDELFSAESGLNFTEFCFAQ